MNLSEIKHRDQFLRTYLMAIFRKKTVKMPSNESLLVTATSYCLSTPNYLKTIGKWFPTEQIEAEET